MAKILLKITLFIPWVLLSKDYGVVFNVLVLSYMFYFSTINFKVITFINKKRTGLQVLAIYNKLVFNLGR